MPKRMPPVLLIITLTICALSGTTALLGAAEDTAEPDTAEPDTAATDEFADLHGLMLYYARGSTAEAAGDIEGAQAAFRAGLTIVPNSPHLLLAFARTAAKLGDDAVPVFSKYSKPPSL